jgi:hypothetical protein
MTIQVLEIEQRRIEVFFPWLLLLRAAVVVDGKKNVAPFSRQALPR